MMDSFAFGNIGIGISDDRGQDMPVVVVAADEGGDVLGDGLRVSSLPFQVPGRDEAIF